MDCYELSQKDICCSPTPFFAEKPGKKKKKKQPTNPFGLSNLPELLSPLSSLRFWGPASVLGVQPPFGYSSGDPPLFPPRWGHAGWRRGARALSKTTHRQRLDGRRLPGDLSSHAPPSCEQPRFLKQKGKTAVPPSRYALFEMLKREEAIGSFLSSSGNFL